MGQRVGELPLRLDQRRALFTAGGGVRGFGLECFARRFRPRGGAFGILRFPGKGFGPFGRLQRRLQRRGLRALFGGLGFLLLRLRQRLFGPAEGSFGGGFGFARGGERRFCLLQARICRRHGRKRVISGV